jgi:hypothetical protein
MNAKDYYDGLFSKGRTPLTEAATPTPGTPQAQTQPQPAQAGRPAQGTPQAQAQPQPAQAGRPAQGTPQAQAQPQPAQAGQPPAAKPAASAPAPTPQPAPTQGNPANPVSRMTLSASADQDLGGGVRVKAGDAFTVSPGDLSGNVEVDVNGQKYRIPDANLKALIQQGQLSIVQKESLSGRVERLIVEVGTGQQAHVRTLREALPDGKPRRTLTGADIAALNRALGRVTEGALDAVPVEGIRECLAKAGLKAYAYVKRFGEAKDDRGYARIDIGAENAGLTLSWRREAEGFDVVAYVH